MPISRDVLAAPDRVSEVRDDAALTTPGWAGRSEGAVSKTHASTQVGEVETVAR